MAEQSPKLFAIFSAPLKREDSELWWMLVALAVAALSGAGIATVVGRGVWLVLLITYFGGGALMCLMAVGLIRNRYSVAGIAWFMGTILTFNVWNILVLQLSFS
ncbi:MAG TPA: hypothetical protein VES90_11760, partial [Candidatus Eisenbacteria bacterium]|nr:hypothetical protein [Candidatus Eisenbacteria bacterium]